MYPNCAAWSHARVVPYSRLRDTAAKGIGVTVNCMGVTSFYDGVSPDTGLDQVCNWQHSVHLRIPLHIRQCPQLAGSAVSNTAMATISHLDLCFCHLKVGDIRMKPDLATARAQPWRMTNQTVLADMTTNTGALVAQVPRFWRCCRAPNAPHPGWWMCCIRLCITT